MGTTEGGEQTSWGLRGAVSATAGYGARREGGRREGGLGEGRGG